MVQPNQNRYPTDYNNRLSKLYSTSASILAHGVARGGSKGPRTELPSCHDPTESSAGELERNGPTARSEHPTHCNQTQANMHDVAEIAPLLKREGGADSGNDLKRNRLVARGGGCGGDGRCRPRSRGWRGNAGIAGVVMFSVAFLGLFAIFKTIQSERTPRSSSTLQEMAVTNARLGSTGPDPRTQGQSGETHQDICVCSCSFWLGVRDGKQVLFSVRWLACDG